MEANHNDHHNQLNNYKKLDVHGSQCTVPASLLDHLGHHLANHDKGEWNDWNEEAELLVRDCREDHKIKRVVIGQISELALITFGSPVVPNRDYHGRIHNCENTWSKH